MTTDQASPYSDFTDRLVAHLSRGSFCFARRDIDRYLRTESFTGRFFEEFIDVDHPNEVTARDLIAVEMLSVQVPANVTIWLLDEGRRPITRLLEQVPADIDIWEATDEQFDALERLWTLLDTAFWPTQRRGNGMGATKKSKLIAAKRPRMAPVIDSVVTAALGSPPNMWDAYRYAFDQPEFRELSTSAVGDRGKLSLLRSVDVAVWMANTHPESGDPDIDAEIARVKQSERG